MLLAWGRLRGPAGTDYERYHNKVFTCVAGVDGDTVDIDARDGRFAHTRIRLWGVDTPENARSDAGAMYFGPEASAFTKSLVLGKPVRILLSPDRARDTYGRLLAYVYVADSETMLNEELIRRGYGYADRRFDHVWRERFESLEEKAKKHKEGLWAGIKHNQMPPWRERYEGRRADRNNIGSD